MTYSIYLALALATAGRNDPEGTPEATPDLADVLEPAWARLRDLVGGLRQGPLSPLAAAAFERDLQHATRELARVATQWAYNHLEPADPKDLPAELKHEGSRFRRLTKKTPQPVSTLFGTITCGDWATGRHPGKESRCCSRCAGRWDWFTVPRPPWSSASPTTRRRAGPRRS